MAAGAGGCFPGDATVMLDNGQSMTMANLTVGDRVLTYDEPSKQLQYSTIVTFLHRSPFSQKTHYVTMETDLGHRLRLTPGG